MFTQPYFHSIPKTTPDFHEKHLYLCNANPFKILPHLIENTIDSSFIPKFFVTAQSVVVANSVAKVTCSHPVGVW
jgi:hypothetical protein